MAIREAVVAVTSSSPLADEEVVKRVQAGESALFEILMRRHNRRLYRAVRSILRDENEVEDVIQQAYINAFTHLRRFEERAQFSTWLTRIALNEALGRRRRTRGTLSLDAPPEIDAERGAPMEALSSPEPGPERQAYAGELKRLLEDAIDGLPQSYRTVFALRDVEGLSTAETAEVLALGEEAVKTRLHRARAMLRRAVSERMGAAAGQAFDFPAVRCDRVVAAVLRRLQANGLVNIVD